MSKATDKRAFSKQREAFEKDVLKNIKTAIKGTGWRKSQWNIFKSVDGLFLNASLRTHTDSHDTSLFFTAKPMVIDEVFWDVMQIPENREQPLSFRASAWFICSVPQTNKQVVNDKRLDAPQLTQKILQYAEDCAADAVPRYDLIDYTNQLEGHEEQISNGNYSTTLFCLYCVAGDVDKARLFAADHVSGKRHCGHMPGTMDQDFFELGLEYLEGSKPAPKWKFWK